MINNRYILTLRLQKIKIGARGLQNTKFYALLIVLAVLTGTLCMSPAISSLMNSVIIGSSGQISIPTITAASGYWQDIQAAVDWIVARGGIGNVYIPEGTFNFVNVGEDLGAVGSAKVTIPAGVNLFGAPTERTSGLPYDGVGQNPNDQVVEWKTILRLPWDVPGTWHYGGVAWFRIVGDSDPNKPSRFSDIKLVGYKSIDSNSMTAHAALRILDVVDFRLDHCYFGHTTLGVGISGVNTRGVVDHCFFVNPVASIGVTMDECDVFYGVGMSRGSGDLWENDVTQVLGQYTDYTVFIEDCYFEKWRHVTASNSGAHYVFRHNTIKDDFGYGSIDAHGWFQTRCTNPQHGTVDNPPAVEKMGQWVCGYEVLGNPDDICGEPLGGEYFTIRQVGTRAVEIYGNQILDSIQDRYGAFIRGGSGVAFNNRMGGGNYTILICFSNDARTRPEGSKVWVNDVWIWDNTLLEGMTLITKYDPDGQIIEGENYHLHEPHTFNYQPYPYPHPLTLETVP
jgi:hypothetical protein